MPDRGTRHLRISKSQSWDNRERWTLNDINLGNNLHKIIDDNSIINREVNSIPYMNVFEFQPSMYRNIQQYITQIRRQIVLTIQHIKRITTQKSNKKLSVIVESLGKLDSLQGVSTGIDKLSEEFLVNYDTYNEDVFINPIKDLKSVFSGKYIRSYQIPYTSEASFFADGQAGWSDLSSSDLKLGNSKVLGEILKVGNLLADVPLIPRWVSSGNNKGYYNIFNTFNLVNNNLTNLISNYRFISHLFQGSMWIQRDSYRTPPNIFSIEIPGMVFLQFVSMNISVKGLGNKRQLSDKNLQKLSRETGYKLFEKHGGDIFFPDIWEIELSFKSLIPNNFNTLMNYFQNGYGNGETFQGSINVGSYLHNGKYENDIQNMDEEFQERTEGK